MMGLVSSICLCWYCNDGVQNILVGIALSQNATKVLADSCGSYFNAVER